MDDVKVNVKCMQLLIFLQKTEDHSAQLGAKEEQSHV